jgi:ABC-type uncharacterized transport system permease subunit
MQVTLRKLHYVHVSYVFITTIVDNFLICKYILYFMNQVSLGTENTDFFKPCGRISTT